MPKELAFASQFWAKLISDSKSAAVLIRAGLGSQPAVIRRLCIERFAIAAFARPGLSGPRRGMIEGKGGREQRRAEGRPLGQAVNPVTCESGTHFRNICANLTRVPLRAIPTGGRQCPWSRFLSLAHSSGFAPPYGPAPPDQTGSSDAKCLSHRVRVGFCTVATEALWAPIAHCPGAPAP